MMKVNKWRVSALLLLILLVFPLSRPSPLHAAETSAFTDVQDTDWFFSYVMCLFERGIVKGYGATGEFRPENKVIREHAAKMICLAAGLDHAGKEADFPDRNEMDPTLISYIGALVEQGAISGFGDGMFRPLRNIQRGHAAKIVVHAFGLKMGDKPVNFPDLPADDPAVAEDIRILASNGIVSGYGTTGEFRPTLDITRAQMAKILCLCMAHNAVLKAESSGSLADAEAALELVDALPDDQEADLKDAFTERLLAILDPLKEGLYGFAYWRDVETINRLISNNDLGWAVWQPGSVQPPPSWDVTDWTDVPPFRMTLLEMDSAGLTGSANLSPLSKLEILSLSGNAGLTGLKVRGCKHLVSLVCKNSGLRSLDLTGLNTLFWLNCSGNLELQTLILDGCSGVGLLYCDICDLSSLDLSSLGGMHTLFCQNNQLTSLNLLANTQLERVSCDGNQLTSMVLCPTAVYEGIDARYNKMKGTSSIENGSHLPWDTDPLFLFSPQN